MILLTRGIAHTYEIEMLSRMFFYDLTLGEHTAPQALPAGADYLLAAVQPAPDTGQPVTLLVQLRRQGNLYALQERAEQPQERAQIVQLARLLYRCALQSGCPPLRWGVLTGVRPIKLFHELAAQGRTVEQRRDLMAQRYLVSDEMIALAERVRTAEQAVNAKNLPNGFSLYVSIPFCPQRCSYCSFVSQSVEQMSALVAPYVTQLCAEIAEIGALAQQLRLVLQTVYFGGGTPTTLGAAQLSTIFSQIAHSFDLSSLLEYTVEAGRPDTITEDRLTAMKAAGVGRISVNPQTMNDAVLQAVGRRHTALAVEQAFALARSVGFSCVNMDLIAGLTGDGLDGFAASLERVLALRPDNVTVHALTLKRASHMVSRGEIAQHHAERETVVRMVDLARTQLLRQGFSPYYLYRQKNTVGSLENIGYTQPGREGLYNVFIMDEAHTILAAGAGAVTKLCDPRTGRIERIYNYKYPTEYLQRYPLLQARKERVKAFYEDVSRREKSGGAD